METKKSMKLFYSISGYIDKKNKNDKFKTSIFGWKDLKKKE
jgi:hypothetical protein